MLHIDDYATRRFNGLLHCAGGLLTLVGAVTAYLTYYAPAMMTAERAGRAISRLQDSLHRASHLQREHATLSTQLREVEQNVNRVRMRVPREADESQFLSAVTTIADEVGMTINNLSSGAPQKEAGYSRLDVTIAGLASFEGICRFVDRIRGLSRLAKITGLDVRADPDGQALYPFTLTSTIFFDLLIQQDKKEPSL
jgi:Tfp pilus assembly protein PilO